MPKISIGLPVYNGERYLSEAIDSILAQTFTDFELIISDNGSTDRTAEICRHHAAGDSRIRLELNAHNRGAAWNYNHVFSLARGDFFKWSSHDDVIAPTHLQRCIETFADRPEAVLCYPQTLLIDEQGCNPTFYPDGLHLVSVDPVERLERFLFRPRKKCNPVLGLIRKEVLARTGLIGSYNASDQVLLAHLAMLGPFFEIPDQLMFRREHPGASLRANATAREVAAWFNPARRGRVVLPALRQGWEYLRCIRHADLDLQQQLRCSRLVVKHLWWSRHQVVREVKAVLGGIG